MGDQTFLTAAANEKIATIYVAIELSKKSWLVGIQGLPNKKVSHHKLEPGDAGGLVALIRRKRQDVARTGIECFHRSNGILVRRCLTTLSYFQRLP